MQIIGEKLPITYVCFSLLCTSAKGEQLVAHLFFLGFCFTSPVRRRVAQADQGMSARTLCIAIRLKKQLAIPLSNHKTVAKWLVISWQTTPAKSLVMFEHVVRVPQPPDQTSNAGYPAGAANRGRLFFGYFILAKQKKVTDRTTSHLTNPANDAG